MVIQASSAPVGESDDGGLVRPLGGFEADTLVPCGRTQQGEHLLYQSRRVGIQLAM